MAHQESPEARAISSIPLAMGDGDPPELTEPTHAGAVVYRMRERRAMFLLFRAQGQTSWSLPDGRVAAEESTAQAAARHLRAVAGMEAEMLVTLGSYDQARDGADALIEMFLGRVSDPTARAHVQVELRWAEFREALELLEVPEARACIRQAVRELLELRP